MSRPGIEPRSPGPLANSLQLIQISVVTFVLMKPVKSWKMFKTNIDFGEAKNALYNFGI